MGQSKSLGRAKYSCARACVVTLSIDTLSLRNAQTERGVRDSRGPSSCNSNLRVPAAMVRNVRSCGFARGCPAAIVVMRNFSA